MELHRKGDALEITDLDPFLAELMRQITPSANPDGVATAEQRLFSRPADPAREGELCAEWKSYVEPDLRDIFSSASEIVLRDLQQLGGDQKPFANCMLRIPRKHEAAWLNALNQARLVIASKYGFTEHDLSDRYRSPIGSRRDLSLFQVNFYGFLQEFILSDMETE